MDAQAEHTDTDKKPYAVRKDGYAWKVENLQTGLTEIDQLDLKDARIIAKDENKMYSKRKRLGTLRAHVRYAGMV